MTSLIEEKIQKILNKKFKKSFTGGYDAYDVDLFFDEVIEYLKQLNSNQNHTKLNDELNKLKKLLNEEKEKNKLLQTEIDFYKKEGYTNERVSQTLQSLQKKIDDLEKHHQK